MHIIYKEQKILLLRQEMGQREQKRKRGSHSINLGGGGIYIIFYGKNSIY